MHSHVKRDMGISPSCVEPESKGPRLPRPTPLHLLVGGSNAVRSACLNAGPRKLSQGLRTSAKRSIYSVKPDMYEKFLSTISNDETALEKHIATRVLLPERLARNRRVRHMQARVHVSGGVQVPSMVDSTAATDTVC